MKECKECGVLLYDDGTDSILAGVFCDPKKAQHKCDPFYECMDMSDYEIPDRRSDDCFWSKPIRARSPEDAAEKWFDSGDPINDGDSADVAVKHPNGEITKHCIIAYFDINFTVMDYK